MRRAAGAAVAAGALVLALAACGGGDSVDPREPAQILDPSVIATMQGDTIGTLDALANPELVPVLAEKHLGHSPTVRRVSLYDTGFSMEVRDPVKRDNLDDYDYRYGEWSTDPVSVSVRDIEEYEKVTFTLDQVSWDVIPDLMQQAYDGLELEGEKITSVGIDKLEGQPPRIYMSVQGLRGSGSLFANADGTDVEIRRN